MKQWNLLGPPLRPAAADLRLFEREIRAWSEANGGAGARALVLGATPEFPALDWPKGSRVYAADISQEMIAFVWYRSAPFAGGALAARWQSLPLRDACLDLVLGDGCFTMSAWPGGYEELCGSIARVLRPGGRVLMRFHTRPERTETPDAVMAALAAGRFDGFNTFKWRLLAALHGDSARGVRLGDVWEFWRKQGIDEDALAARTGWEPAIIRTIHAYRDKDILYSFPSLAELRVLLASRFREVACHRPDYDDADFCRVFALEKAK